MKRKAPGSKPKNKTKNSRPSKAIEQLEQVAGVQLVSGAAANGAIAALLDRMDCQSQNFIWFESDFN